MDSLDELPPLDSNLVSSDIDVENFKDVNSNLWYNLPQWKRKYRLSLTQEMFLPIYTTPPLMLKKEEVLAKLKIRGVFAAIGITEWNTLWKNQDFAREFCKFSSKLNNILVKCNASKQILLKDHLKNARQIKVFS